MDPSRLAERLRGIIKAPAVRPAITSPGLTTFAVSSARPGHGQGSARTPRSVEDILGGRWCDSSGGRSFVVDHRVEADRRHGRVAVGELAERHRRASRFAPLLSGGAPARPPFVFFDLETTGLNGGAGTLAFLVACGWFDTDGAFVTRQHVLMGFSEEQSMLGAMASDLASAGTLVSFNGKSFDAPLLETRYLFHRLEWMLGAVPHIDVLHPSRNFWGRDGTPRAKRECSLVVLEQHVLGVRRDADVSGFEIPGRYFQFVRSGDARPLLAVLEHNRLDLLSLAGLSARLFGLLDEGEGDVRDACEALALGHLYARAGLDLRARGAFERAVSMAGTGSTMVRIEALRSLACAARRARQYEEAARRWRQVLEVSGCPQHASREASEALAIHHEHRAGDLTLAKAFALKSLDAEARPAWNDAVQHRLARIQRKIARAELPGLLAY
jgi:uncharacterized protein YprB with RNaseH-like and TPR domain